MPGGESRPAPGLRNLGWRRETPLRTCRKARRGVASVVSPGGGDRCGGRGLNPFRRFPSSPAQAGRAMSIGRAGNGTIRGCARGLVWLQKSASGVRSERPTCGEPSSPRVRLGLAIQPSAWVVKGRWKPVPRWRHRGPGVRLLMIPRHPAGEAQAKLGGARGKNLGRCKPVRWR